MTFFRSVFLSFAAALVALACPSSAGAQSEDDLLPVDKAFVVEAKALNRETVRLEWKITPHYYLYRDRIKVSSPDAGVSLATHELPTGEKKHDEYLGDVEVYHQNFASTQTLTVPATATEVNLAVRYQGCHEVDPKICFPPHTTKLAIVLPAPGASGDAAAGASPASSGPAATEPALIGTPLPVDKAFTFEAIATGPREILARFTMPKGYYLYRDKTQFDSPDAKLAAPAWPAGKQHRDANFGDTTVYFDQVEIPIGVTPADASARTLRFNAQFQGCLEGSVCYPLTSRGIDVPMPAAGAGASTTSNASAFAASAKSSAPSAKTSLADHGSLLLGLLGFFFAGLGLAFTPCVFPMIPILSGIIAGAGENLSTKRALILSIVYVLASAAIFTLAGVFAGLAGKNLQAAFQTPWVLWCFAGLFVLLSLSMFGFYELQLPSSWQNKLANVSNRQSGGSLIGVAIMGALSALIVGPCVTPPLAAAVIYIAETHDPFIGGAALFTLALGMGAPLVVFGASAGRFLPRAGAWMDAVKAVFGVSFLGLAIWMLSRILDAAWIMLMAGALAVASRGLPRRARPARRWRKRLAQALEGARRRPADRRRRGAARRGIRWRRRAAAAARRRRGERSGAGEGARVPADQVRRRRRARACRSQGGRKARHPRFLRRLVRRLQGNGEIHFLTEPTCSRRSRASSCCRRTSPRTTTPTRR